MTVMAGVDFLSDLSDLFDLFWLSDLPGQCGEVTIRGLRLVRSGEGVGKKSFDTGFENMKKKGRGPRGQTG